MYVFYTYLDIYVAIVCLCMVCRSYYRCTNPRCGAKKQVERCSDDPETIIITYEGLHLHFSYPFFLIEQQQERQTDSPLKKQRKPIPTTTTTWQGKTNETQQIIANIETAEESPGNATHCTPVHLPPPPATVGDFGNGLDGDNSNSGGGLLEDVVPLLIRKPLIKGTSFNSSTTSFFPSPPTSPSSISWPPDSCNLGFGF